MLFAFVGTFVSCEKSNLSVLAGLEGTYDATIKMGTGFEDPCTMDITKHNNGTDTMVVSLSGAAIGPPFVVKITEYNGEIVALPCQNCLRLNRYDNVLSGSLRIEHGKIVFYFSATDSGRNTGYTITEN